MAAHYPKLSLVLRKLLFDRNMKSVDLAREVKMPPATVHRIVTGRSTRPYISSLETIAKYFNLSISELTGDGTTTPNKKNKLTNFEINQNNKIKFVTWDNLEIDKSEQTELIVHNISNRGFALIMPDFSMEPLFPKGSILIFDPESQVKDHSYVLLKNQNLNNYIFRQLLIDENKKFIKALNPNYNSIRPRALNPEDIIIARLVESRNKL